MIFTRKVFVFDIVVRCLVDVVVYCVLYKVISKVESSEQYLFYMIAYILPIIVASVFEINQN